MPSPLAHAAIGAAIYRLGPARRQGPRRGWLPPSPLLLAVVGLTLLPDLDAVVGIVLGDLGRYHNNFVGTPVFGSLVALAVGGSVWICKRADFGRWFGLAFVCYQMHVLMDYFTVGRGVMLFWPSSRDRFSSPFPLFYGLHWSEGLLSSRHWITLASELGFALLLLVAVHLVVRSRNGGPGRELEHVDP